MAAGMTAILPLAGIKRILFSGLLAGMILSAAACATEVQTRTSMDTQQYTLWQLIDALGHQPSLAPDKIVLVLPVEFSEKSRNAYFSFHDGGRLDLADKIVVEKVELRTSLKDGANGMVVLSLGGMCLTIDQVRAHFPAVALAGFPRGRSLDEETTYTTLQGWGQLSFGFKERKPECLATVVVDRTSTAPDSD